MTTAIERHAARWARRRQMVLARRQRLSAPVVETARTSVRYKVQTADGPRWVRVSPEVAAVLRERDASMLGNHADGVTVSAFALWERATGGVLEVEAPASQGVAGLMSERPLGLTRAPSWTTGAVHLDATGMRRAGRTLTGRMTPDERDAVKAFAAAHMPAHADVEARKALARARLAWWQNRAGAEAQAALWRWNQTRKVTGRTRSGAAKADAPKLASARREASFARQRAALTAAAIASGQLTND